MAFEHIYSRDKPFGGAKGLIFLGKHTLLATTRDDLTPSFPFHLDLVGGGRELTAEGELESPFETFRREAREEVGLTIRRRHIRYARWYSHHDPQYTGVMLVAHMPASAIHRVQLGDEGKSVEYFDSLPDLLARDDLIPVLRSRLEDYANFPAIQAAPLRVQIA